jgi:hypothetical protein
MEHNQNPFAPEAATDEPASLPSPPAASRPTAAEPDDPLCPDFATEAEENAYWQGMAVGIRSVSPAPPDAAEAADETRAAPAFESRRQRRARHDGFTPVRRALFLESLAEGLTVAGAAGAAGISTNTAYNLRNRREGRAFAIVWEAALRRGRLVLADQLRDRGIEGQVVTRYDKDGNVTGSRHYHDNRLAMATLTRLDAKVEAYRDDERLVTAVAEEFEALLDCIEDDGDAEALIEALRPPPVELGTVRIQEGGPDAGIAARWARMRFGDSDPDEVDVSDLDLDKRDEWTDDQWERAEAGGLLDGLAEQGDDEDGAEA